MIQNPSNKEIKNILDSKKTIAVVGLSNNPERTSYQIAKIMQEEGYKIIPVNPSIDSVLGEKAFASLKEIKEHVDIVNVFRRSEYLPDIAREAVEIGADVFWSQMGIENEEAFNYLREHGVTTVMNRCIKVEYYR